MMENCEWKPLESLCSFRNGLWKGKKPPFSNVSVIRNTNFNADGTLNDSDIANHDVEERQFATRQLEFGDIILEKSGGGPKQPVGRVITFEKKGGEYSYSNFTSRIRVLDPRRLDFRYLHRVLYWYYVSGATEPLQRRSTGIRNLIFNEYKSLQIPIPSISTQRRIVGVLDEAFAGIATAKANAEKNLQNARDLFESYLDAVFTEGGNGWKEKKLDDVCEVIRGSSPRPIKQYLTNSSDGVNWVKIGDATGSAKYITSTRQKITKKGAERSRKVSPGDLVLTNSMSYGQAYIMAIDGYVHDGWFVLRNFGQTFDLDFFFIILTSGCLQTQFGNLAAGAVVKNISGDLVKKALLPVPPMEKQREIVVQTNERLVHTRHLESIYQSKIEALEELKKSLLYHAFSGQL